MDLFTVGFGPFLGSKCVSGRLYAVALPGRPTPLHRVPVVHADHDRDENWFLLGKALLHELAYLALALVDQPGRLPHLADNSDIGGFGIGLLEAISEPFGHGIAPERWRVSNRIPPRPARGYMSGREGCCASRCAISNPVFPHRSEWMSSSRSSRRSVKWNWKL